MKKKLTGLSLSMCVKDICKGKVSLEEVDAIIAGTRIMDQEDWNYVLERYCLSYWYEFQEKAKEVANYLRDNNMFQQPRAEGYRCHNISHGWWLDEKGNQIQIMRKTS
jgi:hypothetical protein